MFNPRPPLSLPGWSPTGSATSSDPRGILPADRLMNTGGNTQAAVDAEYAAEWDRKVAQIQAALTQSAGFERIKLERQLEDAEQGRKNAWRIAQLSAETSRYGTDVNRETELARLKETARQFDANHGLDQQKLGLNVAEAYTRYASTPDQMFMLRDFEEGLARTGAGQNVQPYASGGNVPQAKTWEDFAALSGYEQMPAVRMGMAGARAPGAAPNMTGATTDAPPGPSGEAAAPDPRIKAARAIMEAVPPSDDDGMDDNDWAGMTALQSLYRARRQPGFLQRLRPGQQAAFGGMLARGGLYAPDALADIQRSGIGQKSPRAY